MMVSSNGHITYEFKTNRPPAKLTVYKPSKSVFEFEDPHHFGVQGEKEHDKYKRTRSTNNLRRSNQGDPSWWTAEEENDRISMKRNKSHKKYIVIFSESVFVRLLH